MKICAACEKPHDGERACCDACRANRADAYAVRREQLIADRICVNCPSPAAPMSTRCRPCGRQHANQQHQRDVARRAQRTTTA